MSNRQIDALIIIGYRLAILAGCAWLVAEHGWSGWWFVLAIFLCECVRMEDK